MGPEVGIGAFPLLSWSGASSEKLRGCLGSLCGKDCGNQLGVRNGTLIKWLSHREASHRA